VIVLAAYVAASAAIGVAVTGAHTRESGALTHGAFLAGFGWAVVWPLAVPFSAYLFILDRRGRLHL
jgi:hypothetical protein